MAELPSKRDEFHLIAESIAPAGREVSIVTRNIADMSTTHAQAVRDATRNQFATPARQQSVRHVCAVAAILLIMAGAFYLALQGKLHAPVATVIVAAVGALAAGPTVSDYLNAARKKLPI